jgi:heme o synthase
MKEKIKNYYHLTKPGIIRGNLMTAAAGFFLAAKQEIEIKLLLATLLGTALIIAASCVINNFIDRKIDEKMSRTQKRALVTGVIGLKQALAYAGVLLAGGFLALASFTNWLTVAVGLAGFLAYVGLYSLFKRRSAYGTLVGSVSGAMPPLAGYVAVSNQLDTTALILFLILCFWQMPHFYAIAIYRKEEYAAAGLPVWPIKHGLASTRRQMIVFMVFYLLALVLLKIYGSAGLIFLIVNLSLGLAWLWFGLNKSAKQDYVKWAKQIFGLSLLVLMTFSVSLYFNAWLP